MKKYIGCKMIEAEPAYKIGDKIVPIRPNMGVGTKEQLGYKVKYPDGYESWSPEEVFEKAYMQVGDNNTITQENVDNFIKHVEVKTMGTKTTVVMATLVNGFIITESSSCVDENNYDEKLGAEICMEKIKDKIWMLLGFLLQTAFKGMKGE